MTPLPRVIGENVCPESGVRGCAAGRAAVPDPHAAAFEPGRNVCPESARTRCGARRAGGSNAPRRVCHGIHHAPDGRPSCRSGGGNAGLRMPRHTPHGRRGTSRPVQRRYAELRMSEHAQAAGHGGAPPLPADICPASHATAYRVRTQAGTMIQAPIHTTTGHTFRYITPITRFARATIAKAPRT